jgi:hypothetical protein
MKVAQYPAAAGLGNDAKRNSRPDRDDRTVWLLVSYLRLRERMQPIDRPVRDGPIFLNANPALRTGLLLSSGPSGTVAALRVFPSLHFIANRLQSSTRLALSSPNPKLQSRWI